MNPNPIDLHFHSTASDGALAPAEVIARAAANGARLVALTDHDCTAGVAEAQLAGAELGVTVLGGVEVSVSWGKERTLHIVGLNVDAADATLEAGLASIRNGRIERAQQMAASLARVGIEGAFEGAMQRCERPENVSRTHFARFLVETGQVKDVRSVFRKYLTPGKPGYIEHQWATLGDAVGWIRAAGGIAVIAHPGRYEFGRTLNERLLTEFREAGGEAIEVVSGSHSLDETHKFALLAERFGMLASAGSDFHAPGEGGRDVGRTDALPPICTPVWSRWDVAELLAASAA